MSHKFKKSKEFKNTFEKWFHLLNVKESIKAYQEEK